MTDDRIRLRLFFVSYAPLWAMLAFRAIPNGKWIWNGRTGLVVFFGLAAFLAIVDAARLIQGAKKTSGPAYYFAEINDQGGNAAGYLATFLLPFVGLAPTDWGDWVSYGIYLIAAAIVFIRTDLTFVNPTLYMLKYRVVSANAYLTEDHSPEQLVPSSPVIVVCRNPKMLSKGRVNVVKLGGGYIAKN